MGSHTNSSSPTNMPLPLQDKVLAITGAASGIGLALSKVAYARGAKLSLADLSLQSLNSAVSSFAKDSSRVLTTAIDVRKSDTVDAWIAATVEKFGRLDGAANLAGVIGKHIG